MQPYGRHSLPSPQHDLLGSPLYYPASPTDAAILLTGCFTRGRSVVAAPSCINLASFSVPRDYSRALAAYYVTSRDSPCSVRYADVSVKTAHRGSTGRLSDRPIHYWHRRLRMRILWILKLRRIQEFFSNLNFKIRYCEKLHIGWKSLMPTC